MNQKPAQFTLSTSCVLLIRTTKEDCIEVLLPNYAAASVSGCEALKNGALSVEIIPDEKTTR